MGLEIVFRREQKAVPSQSREAAGSGDASLAINLGTIYYDQREFVLAERFYRSATKYDPRNALAFFDLGNALDELNRWPEAAEAFQRALEIAPRYADTHYNLALLLEKTGEKRSALHHWRTYIGLDPVGPWASHANLRIKKILASDPLQLVPAPGTTKRPSRSVVSACSSAQSTLPFDL